MPLPFSEANKVQEEQGSKDASPVIVIFFEEFATSLAIIEINLPNFLDQEHI